MRRSTLVAGDCLDVLARIPGAAVDAIVTDPPYGLGFMGKQWDDLPPGIEFAAECLRVLKPGGHLLAFGGTRTYHRLVCAVEDAGFEIRDCVCWLYGSGFPKSHDVSKAIDKAAGAEREVVGERVSAYGTDTATGERVSRDGGGAGLWGGADPRKVPLTGDPVTPDAVRWQGWGTALKPAFEPIVVARKPLVGTVAANVLAHGAGALNVDGCRIGYRSSGDQASAKPGGRATGKPGALAGGTQNDAARVDFEADNSRGRWPANVVLDPEAAAMLDAQTGPSRSTIGKPRGAAAGNGWGMTLTGAEYADSGGASRFFYCAKASSKERNAGLDGLEKRAAGVHDDDAYVWPLNGDGTPRGKKVKPRANHHPTVKPIALMRWLVRLVTPPGGIVLDPFAGSGTTGIACHLEGLRFFGVEREADYVEIARARLAHWTAQGVLSES